MATGKTYWWIKLKKDFLTGNAIDFLMGEKDGASYVVLYLILCTNCINTGGVLANSIGEMIIPFNIDKIQRDCKYFSKDTIIVALELFKKIGMVYEQKDGMLFLPRMDCITEKVNIKTVFYMPTRRRVDLTNLLESIDDVLVKGKIIEDDNANVLVSHDGSRVFYDKKILEQKLK